MRVLVLVALVLSGCVGGVHGGRCPAEASLLFRQVDDAPVVNTSAAPADPGAAIVARVLDGGSGAEEGSGKLSRTEFREAWRWLDEHGHGAVGHNGRSYHLMAASGDLC